MDDRTPTCTGSNSQLACGEYRRSGFPSGFVGRSVFEIGRRAGNSLNAPGLLGTACSTALIALITPLSEDRSHLLGFHNRANFGVDLNSSPSRIIWVSPLHPWQKRGCC